VAGLAIVSGLVIVNQWAFRSWFETGYFRWYLANGTLIGFTTTIASLTWGDLNKHSGLISAHPLEYLGSCLQLVGLPLIALGGHLESNSGDSKARNPFDLLLTMPMVLILVIAMLIWLVVVAPFLYFVYLLCGAPARTFSDSTRNLIARLNDTELEVKVLAEGEAVPSGWWYASLTQKPVAMTNLFVALFFFSLRGLLG
jgi:hypothetical protein